MEMMMIKTKNGKRQEILFLSFLRMTTNSVIEKNEEEKEKMGGMKNAMN